MLSWNDVFSLNFPDVDPDVTYCVDMYKLSTVYSFCNITVSTFYFTLPSNVSICGDYSLIISAVNIVGRSESKENQVLNTSEYIKFFTPL